MHELRSHEVVCPYCGKTFTALVDCSEPRQEYVEDCEICCRPIEFAVVVSEEGDLEVTTTRDDE